MWNFLRGRHSVYERTADGRERIVLRRRHSHHGGTRESGHGNPPASHRGSRHGTQGNSSSRAPSVNDDRNARWHGGQYQQLIAENDGLRADNTRLLRDNQALQRALRDAAGERDFLASQNQARNLRANAMQRLEEGLEAEQSARRRAEKKLRDERVVAERTERQLLAQITQLRTEETTWRTRAAALTREVQEFMTLNRQKETRIRDLEDWMRRQGIVRR